MGVTQMADGVFATVGAGAFTWEVRRLLVAGEESSSLGKTTIDGPCKIICAYCSSVAAASGPAVPTDNILVELALDKTEQLTKRVDDEVSGANDARSNAVTLTALSSKDAVRMLMFDVPEGQHELTARFRWRQPGVAAANFVDQDVGIAFVVQPSPE